MASTFIKATEKQVSYLNSLVVRVARYERNARAEWGGILSKGVTKYEASRMIDLMIDTLSMYGNAPFMNDTFAQAVAFRIGDRAERLKKSIAARQRANV